MSSPTAPRLTPIKRADLYRALYEAARGRGIEVHHGKRLVDVQTVANGGVTACFEDGTRATGDVLIGADGIHSRVRRIICADSWGEYPVR